VTAAQLNRNDVAKATRAARTVALEHGRWLAAPGDRRAVKGERVLLVADELAAPEVALVAARAVRKHGASHVSLAVPVCASSVLLALPPAVDSTLFVESSQLESPHARIYRDEIEPSNVEAAEMLARSGHPSAHVGGP
jgi:predicted phosphoribosyltransferase